MSTMSWLNKLFPSTIRTEVQSKKGIPEGVWSKCLTCESVLYKPELEKQLKVCAKCGTHMRINATSRVKSFLDRGEFELFNESIQPVDALKFKDKKRYKERLASSQKKTGHSDALLTATGKLFEAPVVVVAFEFDFMGGSMGAVVGEKFVRAVKLSIENEWPLISFAASGGARMQEAVLSLLQMAKTSAAISELQKSQVPFISVLTDPTMGGVSASLAMLGDVIIAEPGALIGFAGPRVIEQTVRQTLPEGFQRSEFLLEHGAIDMIVPRPQLRTTIHRLIQHLQRN